MAGHGCFPTGPHAVMRPELSRASTTSARVCLLVTGGRRLSRTLAARARQRTTRDRSLWPAAVPWVMTVVLMLVALSPRVTLGDRVLVDLVRPVGGAVHARFARPGRFLWPLTYLLLTWTVVAVALRLRPRTARRACSQVGVAACKL